ncbi:Meiotic recombination protein SPO11 [Cytospora mali]|uniref:DNA topoisomerase (ATP-hydrolyzing) n=1 Tax=Cytospora mali TaxID=578113 RepID=A0A194USX3_CYTMA|nr:Meiotic recombination protein SPO11 [Valsa mali var. pyri (nom. inval.)]
MSYNVAEVVVQLASSSSTISAFSPSASQSSRIVAVPQNAIQDNQTGLVISKIENSFAAMVDILAGGGDFLSIPYRSRSASQRAQGALRFPGSNVQEATKFTRMMRIMELAREALVSGRLITKRNIYYQNPDLFKNQGNVDQLVDDLAFTLRVGRDALNIVAASQGLIAGPIKLIMKNNSIISCFLDLDDNRSIPPIAMIREIDFGETRWILVVEKEATFRTLAVSQYWRNCVHGQGIIVTGKGYADLATLEFLNLVHSMRPILPILCVVDCDPHGIDIMRTYKYGSRSMRHEEKVIIPGLQWLGVKIEDVVRQFAVPEEEDSPQSSTDQSSQSSGGYFSIQTSGSLGIPPLQPNVQLRPQRSGGGTTGSLMSLTVTDRKTAQRIFKAMTAGDQDRELDHEETEQLRELQVMLMLNMKAEIQAIDNMGDLSDWLDDKIGLA